MRCVDIECIIGGYKPNNVSEEQGKERKKQVKMGNMGFYNHPDHPVFSDVEKEESKLSPAVSTAEETEAGDHLHPDY
jgi:hypothetical protein